MTSSFVSFDLWISYYLWVEYFFFVESLLLIYHFGDENNLVINLIYCFFLLIRIYWLC